MIYFTCQMWAPLELGAGRSTTALKGKRASKWGRRQLSVVRVLWTLEPNGVQCCADELRARKSKAKTMSECSSVGKFIYYYYYYFAPEAICQQRFGGRLFAPASYCVFSPSLVLLKLFSHFIASSRSPNLCAWRSVGALWRPGSQ